MIADLPLVSTQYRGYVGIYTPYILSRMRFWKNARSDLWGVLIPTELVDISLNSSYRALARVRIESPSAGGDPPDKLTRLVQLDHHISDRP